MPARLRRSALLPPSLVCASAIWALAAPLPAAAQAATAGPEFEAAVLKPAAPPAGSSLRVGCNGGPGTTDPVRIVCENYPLLALLSHAFGVKDYQVSGPDWLASERYDVTASLPPGVSKEQGLQMWRNLLTAQLKLAAHNGTREMPVYSLELTKDGPKLEPARPGAAAPPPASAPKPSPPGTVTRDIRSSTMPISQFAASLGLYLDRPIIDHTGLTGVYNINFEWLMDGRIAGPGDDLTFAIRSALPEQLGLKLESRKSSVPVIFIDHIEKTPSGN
jgi:uncharacterized protein (TIGR03435 family)